MISLLLAVIYLAFISLGLPDSLLGSAWPTMQIYFNVPSSYVGFVSMTIAAMTIISSLFTAKLVYHLTTKWVVIISIFLTIIGMFGFSIANSFYLLFIFAVPYGLGAGAIDASLNSFVANHYSARVMNFLHCFYGVGSIISPNIMGLALRNGHFSDGYRYVSFIQMGILLICILSIPLWLKVEKKEEQETKKEIKIKDAIKIPGVVFALISFFSYCSGEATCFLWTSSFFNQTKDISKEMVASFGSLVFFGLMVSRIIAGFVSNKINDRNLIRIGIIIETIGILLISISSNNYIIAFIGFILIGIGMGPIYPSIQHMAPINFGKEASNTIISMQMASGYLGTTFMPMLFGILQKHLSMWIMPIYITIFLLLNIIMIEICYKKIKKQSLS